LLDLAASEELSGSQIKTKSMIVRTYYDNLIYNHTQLPWRALPDRIYGYHLENVLERLATELGELYYEFKIVIYDHNMYKPLPDFPTHGKNVILIFLADERSTVPNELSEKFFAIFKSYYPLENSTNNIIPFPIGYSNSADLTKFIPFDEREYETSFAGNFLANRLDFYRQFTLLRFLPPYPIMSEFWRKVYYKILTKAKIFRSREFFGRYGKSRIFWSDGFAKGLPREEYARIISQTKIALCPKGFMSTECFRLMETMRLGSVMISDELPPSRWYKGSPIIVTTDWLHIDKVIENLVTNPAKMQEIHEKMLAWWRDVCSDEAVAVFLAQELLRLKKAN
jgi:hypothetical protein